MFLSEDADYKSYVKVPFYKFHIYLPLSILISRLKLALVKPLLHLTRTIPYFHEFPLVISILLSFWFNGKHNIGPAWHIHPNLLNMLSVRLKWKKLPYIPRTLINSLQVKSWKIENDKRQNLDIHYALRMYPPFHSRWRWKILSHQIWASKVARMLFYGPTLLHYMRYCYKVIA